MTVFVGRGCHLCELALETVRDVCGDAADVVDITGDAELEERYRTRIPVVEVDGEAVFTYVVDESGLRELLAARR